MTSQRKLSSYSIPSYKGDCESKIQIETWLKWFEKRANKLNWNQDQKQTFIADFLKEEALEYFISYCAELEWEETKKSMISRFSETTITPMIEFIHFKMTHDSDLKTYYEKKRMQGFRASLTLDQIIPVMIDGFPMDIKSHFV